MMLKFLVIGIMKKEIKNVASELKPITNNTNCLKEFVYACTMFTRAI